MDPQTIFCPNSACPARGQTGKGNIGVHSLKDGRYICHICNRTFALTKGTVFYRRRLPRDTIVKIITLLAHGCPRQAIVAAFGVDERTVKSLEEGAGQHCQQVHEHLVEQPRDLVQVQADEIRAKIQGRIL
jgi:transposase-like protein